MEAAIGKLPFALPPKIEEWVQQAPEAALNLFKKRLARVTIVISTLWLLIYIMSPTYMPRFSVLRHKTDHDILRYVDPLIGTYGAGHVFGGPSLPYAMAKPVADTVENNRGGFAADGGKVMGYSHMHDTGIGGGSAMGFFPLFPMPPCKGNIPDGCAPFEKRARALPWKNGSLTAETGYFSLELTNDIRAEMTSSAHAVLYRFTYPSLAIGNVTADDQLAGATARQMFVLTDLSDLYFSKASGEIQIDHITGRMKGSGNYMSSFGNSGRYTAFYCADYFGAPLISAGIWHGDKTFPNELKYTTSGNTNEGAYVQFFRPERVDELYARVGVSMISMDQACTNAENEVPAVEDAFEKLLSMQQTTWKEKLAPLQVEANGVDEDLQTLFWSSLYRNFISPQDWTAENPLLDKDETYFDSYYCLWDSFRVQFPLLTLMDPSMLEKMIQVLVKMYEREGFLPDCHMQFDKGIIQGGTNAEVVIADWAVKMGLTSGIDWNTAYAGMITDAEEEPANPRVQGRSHLNAYKTLGYIPHDDSAGLGLRGSEISRNVEYAYDDYCIASVAILLNRTEDYQKYIERSRNWKNMLRADQRSVLPDGTDTGFAGFMQPRLRNGSWVLQEPSRGSPANWENCCGMFGQDLATYEGSSWMYTLYVPGDEAQLIAELGGDDEFTRRLDYMHDNELLDIGDEQAFLPVYQYHYAGRPGKSTERLHWYIPRLFNSSWDGVPGNDDAGAMGAFVVFAMIGVFPIAGQNVYLISTPYFPEVRITNPITGKVAHIIAHNWDSEYKNMHIQSARLDGEKYTKSWLTHSFFLNGGVLELWLGETENLGESGWWSERWGTEPEDRPPSLSTTGVFVPQPYNPPSS